MNNSRTNTKIVCSGIGSADIFRERGVRDLLGFKAGATVSAEETIKDFEKVFGKGGRFGKATDELATHLQVLYQC